MIRGGSGELLWWKIYTPVNYLTHKLILSGKRIWHAAHARDQLPAPVHVRQSQPQRIHVRRSHIQVGGEYSEVKKNKLSVGENKIPSVFLY